LGVRTLVWIKDPALDNKAQFSKANLIDQAFVKTANRKKFTGWGWTPSDLTKKKATKEALLKIHSPYILHLATPWVFR
jgi:hypothetical protein